MFGVSLTAMFVNQANLDASNMPLKMTGQVN